jgi:hypothetical protein
LESIYADDLNSNILVHISYLSHSEV